MAAKKKAGGVKRTKLGADEAARLKEEAVRGRPGHQVAANIGGSSSIRDAVAAMMEREGAERRTQRDAERLVQRAAREVEWKLPQLSPEPDAFKLLRMLVELRDSTVRSIGEWKEFLHRQVEGRESREAADREDFGEIPPRIAEDRKMAADRGRKFVVENISMLSQRLADIDLNMANVVHQKRWTDIEPSLRKIAETAKTAERKYVARILKAYLDAKKSRDQQAAMLGATALAVLGGFARSYFGTQVSDLHELEKLATEQVKIAGEGGTQAIKIRFMIELATRERPVRSQR